MLGQQLVQDFRISVAGQSDILREGGSVTVGMCSPNRQGSPDLPAPRDPAKYSPHGEVEGEQQMEGMQVPPKGPPSQLEDLDLYPKGICAVFSAEQTWVGFSYVLGFPSGIEMTTD